MKKLITTGIISAIAFLFVFICAPIGIKAYANNKYPEIHINKLSIIGINCAKIYDVTINKPTTSGKINSAVVCYKGKSVDIKGGELNIILSKSSGKSIGTTNGFTINGSELNLHITRGNIQADLYNTNITPTSVCSKNVVVNHPKANVKMDGLCLPIPIDNIIAGSGTITTDLEIKGHKLKEISFKNLTADNTKLYAAEIKYDGSTLYDVYAAVENGMIKTNILSASIYNKKLFTTPLTFKSIYIRNINKNDPLSSVVSINIGDPEIIVDIPNKRISGKDSCKKWLEDVVPAELKNDQISQMDVSGNFGFDVKFNSVSLKISNTCSLLGKTPQFIKDLSKPFEYTAYHPDGTKFIRKTGPNTMEWIPVDYVENMSKALIITEDPGFFHHRGIIPQAIENSLKDDLKKGRFFRGGSTITMQLAKNLWLSREKTLGRKVQEGILTIALESSLTKDQIMELYLNVVEFGPNTYGIGPGCAKFLNKYPGELSLSEALYMALRLPSPNHAQTYESSKGFIKKLIDIGVASGKLTVQDLYLEQEQNNNELIEEE